MTADELDKKIISIKKRGMNILLENELIAEVRGEYYSEIIYKKQKHISDRFRENIIFLSQQYKEFISVNKLKEFMGIDVENSLTKFLYNDQNINSLKIAIAVSEFYGIPVELLLFQDLKTNVETLKKFYPSFLK